MILLHVVMGIAIVVGAFFLYLVIVATVPGFSVPAQPLETAIRHTAGRRAERSESRKDVRFEVKGTSLSAWLYLPKDLSAPVACIVMGHGLGGTKEAGMEAYALRFQEAGFAVLAFDYRYFGQSGGEPRQLAWIPHQIEDYRAAVEYARGLREIDPARIALWGTSLSGGHVIVAAARDRTIACVSAQCPWLNGTAGGMKVVRRVGLGNLLRTMRHGQRDLVRSWFGLSPHRIPIVGRPGSIAMLADADAWAAFDKLVPEGFVNEICARIVIRMDKYRPVKRASRVRCPVLLQVCDKDIAVPPGVVREAERRLGGLAEVIHHPIDHFDIYFGDHFEKAVGDQIAFFKRHLLTLRRP